VERGIHLITVYDLGTLADWVAAFGTISAVIVALYLARRDRQPRALVSSSVSYAVTSLGLSEGPVALNFSIVNIGTIPIHLQECSIQVSKRSKQRLVFVEGNHHKVDKLLGPGEYYEHTLPYDEFRQFHRSKGIKKISTYGFFEDGRGKRYKTKVRLFF
jgi:hypothetical protein